MSGSVLVVDDDRDIREALVQILTEEGFEVTSAGDGAQALAEISRRTPDVVLLDLMMPVMNGWQVLETLRSSARYSKLPVVVLSALRADGCSDYIQKPVSLDRLLSLIEVVRSKAVAS